MTLVPPAARFRIIRYTGETTEKITDRPPSSATDGPRTRDSPIILLILRQRHGRHHIKQAFRMLRIVISIVVSTDLEGASRYAVPE